MQRLHFFGDRAQAHRRHDLVRLVLRVVELLGRLSRLAGSVESPNWVQMPNLQHYTYYPFIKVPSKRNIALLKISYHNSHESNLEFSVFYPSLRLDYSWNWKHRFWDLMMKNDETVPCRCWDSNPCLLIADIPFQTSSMYPGGQIASKLQQPRPELSISVDEL